jgi:hypothetical protein
MILRRDHHAIATGTTTTGMKKTLLSEELLLKQAVLK